MSGLEIRISGGKESYKPGETLEFSASWMMTTAPKSILVTVFWYTAGRGSEDVEVLFEEKIEVSGISGERRYQFKLPLEPYSFSGELISITWAIEAVAKPGKEMIRKEFIVSPTGHEIRVSNDSFGEDDLDEDPDEDDEEEDFDSNKK